MPKYKAKARDNGDMAKGEFKPSDENYAKGNLSRNAQQDAENLPVLTDRTAPKSRYQDNQQVHSSLQATDTSLPDTGFSRKTSAGKGSQVKQEVASRVAIEDSDFAGIPGSANNSAGRSGLKSLQFSGDAGSILGTAANTPVVGTPSRSEGRFEKQLDATNKKINFLASEQVLSEYDNPKPLGESGNDKQGYYGTPKNTSVRSQKIAAGTPADLLVERSADVITRDELFYTVGQYVKSRDANINYAVEPTKSTIFNKSGVRTDVDLKGDNAIKYSNWLNRAMKVTFKKESTTDRAYISEIDYVSEDLGCDEDVATVNAAATNFIADMNSDEIVRQNIDAKAGRETEPGWSPLGRGVVQPTATVGFLQRIENDCGAVEFTAAHFASKGHAYQLNKAAKDGQRTVTPMREMLLGDIVGNMSSKDYSGDSEYFNGLPSAFTAEAYRLGSPALLINLFDSVAKYQTKADVLTQPRSLRHFINTADNNINVFHMKREFANALLNRDVFSTIDRGYDPLLPVCITDKVGLISPVSYSRLGAYTRSAYGADRNFKYTPFEYSYSNRSSNYTIRVNHPILEGLSVFFEMYCEKIAQLLGVNGDNLKTFTLEIPMTYATTCFTLWEFLVLASAPYAMKDRINSLRDILDFETNFEYPFDNVSLKEKNFMNAVNYYMESIDKPLQSRVMIPSVALSWIMPEYIWCIRNKNKDVVNVMPWYFNEGQYSILVDGAANDSGHVGYEQRYLSGSMSMPVIRSGVRLGYLDDLYSMSERDVRLCLDRMVRSPIGQDSDTGLFAVYKYGQANDGQPAITGQITIKDLVSTPRELGWFAVAPAYLLRVKDNLIAKAGSIVNGFSGFAGMTELVGANTSYRLYCWKGAAHIDADILTPATVNVSRAQAFRQFWDCNPAVIMGSLSGTPVSKVYRPRIDVGFLPSIRFCFNDLTAGEMHVQSSQGLFIPFTKGYVDGTGNASQVSTDASMSVIALHKGLWGRLQKLPFVISPWDTCDFDTAGSSLPNIIDPYDYAYMFGLAGFMASDYNQDIYDRINQVQNQGWLYTKDPFTQASPVLRDGSKFTA